MKKLLLVLLLASQTALAQEPPSFDAPESETIIVDPVEMQAQLLLQHLTNDSIIMFACGILAQREGKVEEAAIWYAAPAVHGAEHGLDPRDPEVEEFFEVLLNATVDSLNKTGVTPEMTANCETNYPHVKQYVEDYTGSIPLIEDEGTEQ